MSTPTPHVGTNLIGLVVGALMVLNLVCGVAAQAAPGDGVPGDEVVVPGDAELTPELPHVPVDDMVPLPPWIDPPHIPPLPDIPAGRDCWFTRECGPTQFDLSDITRAGFFCDGSQPYDGTVLFKGRRADFADTIVLRLDPIDFDAQLPSTKGTRIRLERLDLVSCEPISVVINGETVEYDVWVGLSTFNPPYGLMTITKEHCNGGTFESHLYVQPRFTFVPRGGPCDGVILDTGVAGLDPLELSLSPVPWVHELPVSDDHTACGADFVPGARIDYDRESRGTACCCRAVHETFDASEKKHEPDAACWPPTICECCPYACPVRAAERRE